MILGDPESNKPGENGALSENGHPASAVEVPIPDQEVPADVSCGGNHTLVLTREYRLSSISHNAFVNSSKL